MTSTKIKEIHVAELTATKPFGEKPSLENPCSLNNKNAKTIKRGEVFRYWLDTCSSMSTIHGMKWHTYFNFLPWKISSLVFVIVIVFAMLAFCVMEAVKFYTQSRVQTAFNWGKESTLKYPNLTLCFPKLFDNGLVQAEGLSNDLVNYLSLVFDPNAGHLHQLFSQEIPFYASRIDKAESELQSHLAANKISIIDLFHRISIRCENFITLCEIHGKFYFSTSGPMRSQKCCGVLFNSKPFFTSSGTCFTTTMEVWEKWPFTFSYIKVWVNLKASLSPDFEVLFAGSDAVEKRGVFFAISDRDHPAAKLLQAQNKITTGNSAQISLNIMRIDQSELSGELCHSEEDSFGGNLSYNLPYSKMNCEVFSAADTHFNCSMAHFYGVDQENTLRPCEPRDILQQPLSYDTENYVFGAITDINCLPYCLTTEYEMQVSEGAIDPTAIRIFNAVSQTDLLGNPDELVIIKLHFRTFDYETHILYENDFFDFLSKVGGWLGLVLGASVLSFVEIFFFAAALVFNLFKKTERQQVGF